MKGIIAVAVVCLIAECTDAQITAWTVGSGYTVAPAGNKVATITRTELSEGLAVGGDIAVFTATPTASSATVTYAITINAGDVGVISSNTIQLATGKKIDFETSPSLVFVVTAVEASKTAAGETGTATVTVNIKNMLEFSKSKYELCANDGLTAGSVIGTFAVTDAQTGETVTYGGVSNADLEYVAANGVLKVATGKTLNKATTNSYTLALTAIGTLSGGTASAAGAAEVVITVCTPSSAAKVSAVVGAILLSIVASVFI
ncbi:uncharacterized protein LOC127864666 [Dreissena polymorpha]|uniref:uncharacterized protein LOC127864666 n=1 Tax=Dreissena polymorpha TaxID=45954 RepID=UPI0022654C90|nr:uncharacterized protein LOC127864666 [Dreissena polymorpha]